MIIQSTSPARISLFGGGTDVEPYSSQYGGIVLSMAINLRQTIKMYSGKDLPAFNNGYGGVNIIPIHGSHDFYYKILDEYNINDMHHTKLFSHFDGYLEAGLGSSAACAVALLGAINKRLELNLTRQQIAQKAWELETQKLGLFGGKQDQGASAFGGVNIFEFNVSVKVTVLDRSFIEPFMPYFVLLYTGSNRKSAKIQEGLKELSGPQVEALDKIKDTAFRGIIAMENRDIKGTGELLLESWEQKKASNEGVTTPELEKMFKKATKLGSFGHKLCGAGGGGFALFMVEPENRQKFIEGMGLEEFDFDIDYTGLDVRRLS